MDEEENVTSNAVIVIRKSPHSLILVFVVFACCVIKTKMVLVQSHQLLPFFSSPLVCGHIYTWNVETSISPRGNTQKHKQNHVFKSMLFDWLAHSIKFGVGLKMNMSDFSYNIVGWCRMGF